MDNIFLALAEPMVHEFMQRALLCTVFIGVSCAIFSCFLVLKGWSLMGDAVSHAVLPGVAIAYVVGLPIGIGAFCAGLSCAFFCGYIKDHSRVKEDAVMGIVFSGMFAFGLVMLTKIETDVHLLHILFGNVLGVQKADMVGMMVVAAFCSLVMFIKRRDFMLLCFDSSYAGSIGMPLKILRFFMLALLALIIVAALKVSGVILVIAMLIAPGATGFILAKNFDSMMVIAVFVSVLSCVIGVVGSFHLDVSSAPLIVVVQVCFFVAALVSRYIYQVIQGYRYGG